MGRIWTILMLASVGLSVATGRTQEASAALMESGNEAVSLLLTLLAAMTLWSGLMEILTECGDVARLGRLFRRLLRPLFPGVSDAESWQAISMNLSCNLLGLGNAATPAGVEAAKRLSLLGEPGMRALAMLLTLDNAGLQLLPTTVLTLRQAAGAAEPASVWGPTLVTSLAVSVLSAAILMAIHRGGDAYGALRRRSSDLGGRPDGAARTDDGNGRIRCVSAGR